MLQFLSVILTAPAFVPGGAHLFELPNKIGLPQERYFVVQSIYRGWALFGIVLFAAVGTNLLLAVKQWRHGRSYRLTLPAGLILLATLIVFFEWTYPVNQATNNWSAVPADWESLRWQWELSHAANAILTFIALCCATLSILRSADCQPPVR